MENLSVKEKAGYGIGEIASNIVWQTVMFFLAIFYTDTFGLPAAVVGTMFFVVRIFDAINDPIMGTIADRTQTRWGKYRPFLLWMAIPYGVGGVLMFLTPDFGLTGKIVYAYATYIFMMVIYTAIMIPFSALSGVMTSNSMERTSLNSYRFIGAFVGGLFIQGLALYMVNLTGEDNQSIIHASVDQRQLIISEKGAGTARVFLTATDNAGNEVTDEFTVQVNYPGESPPRIDQGIEDQYLEQGFGEKILDLRDVFYDLDNESLIYEVSSSDNEVLTVRKDRGRLFLIEQGFGSASVSVQASDSRGGNATANFQVYINKEGNRIPQLRDSISSKEYTEVIDLGFLDLGKYLGKGIEKQIAIRSYFTDDDELFLLAESSNPERVAASISDDNLVLTLKQAGKIEITVTANDGQGGNAELRFPVIVKTPGATPPSVDNQLPDRILQTGFGEEKIDIASVFFDEDNPELNYSLSVNNSAKGYKITMSIFAVICIGLFLVTFFTSKERVEPVSKERSKLSDDFKDLLKNGPWLILFFVSLVTLIYVGMRSAVIAYYFRYYVGDASLTSAFLVLGSLTIILVLSSTEWLTSIFGKRLLFFICLMVVGLSILGYAVLDPEDIALMFLFQILQSAASAPTMPLLWSMLADTADYSEWKTGRKAMGLAYSASTFAQKAGIAFGGSLALWILSFYGYQANVQQSEQSLEGMKMMMSVYPAIGTFFCAALIWFYKLDDKKMEKIEKELELKRSA